MIYSFRRHTYAIYTRKRGNKFTESHLRQNGVFMTLYEELYFEITLTGQKRELEKLVKFLKSGELDEFFEFSDEYISYDDEYATADAEKETSVILSNEDYGIEIDEFDTDDFLDVFCKAARALDVRGQIYDINDDEYRFVSDAGNSYYINAKNIKSFNEDEDKPVEDDEDEDED